MAEMSLMLLLLAGLAFVAFPLAFPFTLKAKRQAQTIKHWENTAPMELYSKESSEKPK